MRRDCIREPIGDHHLSTPAMREEMQAALDRALFRRSSALRLQAARLYRLGVELLGELPADDRERFIRGLCAYAAAPGIGEWTTPGRWLWRNRHDPAPLDAPHVIVRIR